MPLDFSETHCSRWGGIPQDRLSDDNRKHVEILTRAFRTGVYNLPVNWQKVDWMHGVRGTRFVIDRELSTFDFDHLTRLVILAHDECVRVSIAPRTFRHLGISMWSGRSREGGMASRHPTIEQAVADLRAQRKEPKDAG